MEQTDRTKCQECIQLPICEAEEIPFGDDACNPDVDPENEQLQDALERVKRLSVD